MSTILRLAGIMLLVAFAALVLLPCGAVDGDACLHAYSERSRSVGGIRARIARLVAALTQPAARVTRLPATRLDTVPLGTTTFGGTRQEVAPLRI